MDEIERFDPATFVGRLLGRGDWKGYGVQKKKFPPFFPGEGRNSKKKKKNIQKQVRRPHGRGRARGQGPGGPHGRDLQGPLYSAHDVRPAGQPAEARAGEGLCRKYVDVFSPPHMFSFSLPGPAEGCPPGSVSQTRGGTNSNLIKKKPENPRNR